VRAQREPSAGHAVACFHGLHLYQRSAPAA
jgi:hypothetical protein